MHKAYAICNPAENAPVVNPNIYGHFAEHLGRGIYEGIWVGEDSVIPNTRGLRNDVLAALKKLDIPVLRWPGGCFADEYHWKDGIGPRELRKSVFNTHWGGVVENNHFGTHEFLDLCETLGCEAYVCGNVGSGTTQELSEWVEYITSSADAPMPNLRRKHGREEPWKLAFFGVGNESWGCGGTMRPEFYADEYRRYNTFARNYPPQKVQRIACGPNTADYHWTEVMMRQCTPHMDGLALHYYTLLNQTWPPSGLATKFGEDEWFSTLKSATHMEELVIRHSMIMDQHDVAKTVGLVVDEWGTWHEMEPGSKPGFLYQQNALRDAIVAAIHFHIFQRHADRVTMANIAQTINVLQAMVLTDGVKMLTTPTYHVFEMFKAHQGGQHVPVSVATSRYGSSTGSLDAVSVGATRKGPEQMLLTLTCLDPSEGAQVEVVLPSIQSVNQATILTSARMQDHNTFEHPETVKPKPFSGYEVVGDVIKFKLPSKSVLAIDIRL